jgi:predicted RNA binding protein YcfA (HicA-like mRNA interferase family)
MKRSELERKLKKLGWRFIEHRANHDIWGNLDVIDSAREMVPRHPVIAEGTAKAILKTARSKPGDSKKDARKK